MTGTGVGYSRVRHARQSADAGRWVAAWSPSSAASLTGCVLATSRATQSPTTIWIGDASAATVSGMISAVRL